MFSALSNLTQRLSPTSWTPNDPLLRGFKSSKTVLGEVVKGNSNKVEILSFGSFSNGSIVFATKDSIAPPSYNSVIRTGQDEKKEGGQLGDRFEVEFEIEVRFNDQQLFEECSLGVKQEAGDISLSIRTPIMTPSRLLSQLSYHVTVYLPPIIVHLQTSGALWKHSSLSALQFFETINFQTSNADFDFHSLNSNSINISTTNGSVIGIYSVGSGNGIIKTSNKKIQGSFSSQSSLSVQTSNAIIDGEFKVEDNLTVLTSNHEIKGSYTSRLLDIKTFNARIFGHFLVKEKLVISTSNSPIEVKISLIGEDEDRPSTPDLLDEVESDSRVVKSTKIINVKLNTSNSKIVAEYLEFPNTVSLHSNTNTSNAPITVNYRKFEGVFELSTSNSTTSVVVPSSHLVSYSLQNRTKAVGSISIEGEVGTVVGKNQSIISTSNASISLIIS